MEKIVIEKFNGSNIYTWNVKFQMSLMHKHLWRLVKGKGPTPQYPKKIASWLKTEEKAKYFICFSLLDSQLHLIDLEKSSAKI